MRSRKYKGYQRQIRWAFGISSIVFLSLWTGCKESIKIDDGLNDGRHILINGLPIYVEEYGTGTPLILLSGGGLNRSIKDFDLCITELSKRFRVIAPDSPGQGKSGQPDTLSYELLTSIISQLIDSLKLDSAYVMGLSDGAIVALLLSDQRADKVKRAIAVGANNGKRGFAIPAGVNIDSVKAPSLDYWAGFNKETIEWYKTLIPQKDWQKQVTNLNQMWYAAEYFPVNVYDRIHIPVMIVLGDRDDISIEHGLEMHRLIKGSQFCILPNTTHEVFAEQPELITRIATSFFNNEKK
jgi:pimeloyl-ACP methyl ester carboxylesterase